jgi:pimeloyl-ACP methyl ester carboxylesterase
LAAERRAGAPEREELVVRGTPVHALRGGAGPDLLFLHGAGGAGRWLEFQVRLSERFTVSCPSHPGHGGSPAAEWIEHISDLAFHYLDFLDERRLERVHLVGASFGGWIAAEIAVMASHRLASLTLIDPVGIKVEGWIYPFLFGMDIPELVQTVFHNPMAALALAPPDQSVDTLAHQYRQGAAIARVSWNPYLYDPLLRRRLARITTPTLLCWGAHDRLAPLDPCGQTWAKEVPGARLRVFGESGHVPHIEEPAAVADAIIDFATSREGRR